MKNPVEATKAYVDDVLGRMAVEQPWAEAAKLPFFLQDKYLFYQVEIVSQPCLLMLCRTGSGATPAVVRKHWQTIASRYAGNVIYVVEAMTSFNRKRLIEKKVPFIVPGNQLYLPMLGTDLREHFKQAKNPDQKPLSAPAQVLVLRAALGRDDQSLPAKALAEVLGYSAMTLSRAIKELVDNELASAAIRGREKHLEFPLLARELWQAAAPLLRNPVKKHIVVKQPNRLLTAKIAGEDALAHYTMLAKPKNRMMAINGSEWPNLKRDAALEEKAQPDSDDVQLQLWRYSPGLLTAEQFVDPLSLWLSLEDKKDERVEMALEQLLEAAWSKTL